MKYPHRSLWQLAVLLLFAAAATAQSSPAKWPLQEGAYVASDFHFRSGERLAQMKLHYSTLGQPHRNAAGNVDNAVMLLHGTGGTGTQFLAPQFAEVLFGPGQLLDIAKYYIILPDGIGHGGSSKPSDGMHAHFPQYDYDDMVAAQHMVLTDALHVDHLRLILGTSMGCMQAFVWGETYPEFSDALMPLACLPVQIAGRNRMMREMAMKAITNDPAYNGGEYKTPPAGLKTSLEMLLIMGSSPLQMQKATPTQEKADAYLDTFFAPRMKTSDANDFLYQFNSSRNYDPSSKLALITAPVMWINSADDFINPPELGIAEKYAPQLKRGKFVLIPTSDATRGHGTHTQAAVWQNYLKELLDESKPR